MKAMMKCGGSCAWVVLALVVFFACGVGFAQSAALGDAAGTLVTRLDGGPWVLAVDPSNVGRDQEWWKAPTTDAKSAKVPGVIQDAFPKYHGVAWYWRDFVVPANPNPGGRCLLRFGAVDYYAQVWLNGTIIGQHEGGETPFVLDATTAVKPGESNRLAVRVVNPTDSPIDGMTLAETPHRNKTMSLVVGSMLNVGGIMEPVELILTPAARISDVFVKGDWKSGVAHVQATVCNDSGAAVSAKFSFEISAAATGAVCARSAVEQEIPSGESIVNAEIQVPDFKLWNLDDPCLYKATTRLSAPGGKSSDMKETRFGFRELRVERGYFRLNGKRIFLKSSHTGNHCPVNQVFPPDVAPDLLRKDLLYLKSCGFNMVRFISGIAHPWQLDMCDEIGLMVYEETMAGWCLKDSPKMNDRFTLSVREMVLRDRNHPSATIWGLLNETPDGPVFRRAVDMLGELRALDDSRLVLLSSGRWDGQQGIGSLSNPGSAQWECQWGAEDPSNKNVATWGAFGGYFTNMGDAHVYPATPHTPEIESGIRAIGADTKPVFVSEYGIGSLMNAVQELRTYEQYGLGAELEDYVFLKNTVDKLDADFNRFGLNSVFAFPEEMLEQSQRLHCRQRLLGFNLLRSNPKICGYNLTGLLDHGFTGEGLWTFWRVFKPGIADTLQNGWAPLRWCLFVAPMNVYRGRSFNVEAVLANEDVLSPGDYPVTLRIVGPAGVVWEYKTKATIPQAASGEDAPLAIPVFKGDITLGGAPGEYRFVASFDHGASPAGETLTFHLSDVVNRPCSATVAQWGLDDGVRNWLATRGIQTVPLESAPKDKRCVILVGDVSSLNPTPDAWKDLLSRVDQGSSVVFATPAAFKRGDNRVGWLPLKNKGTANDFSDWLYHKECIAKPDALFEGLQAKGVMDWDYYGPVISHCIFEGQDTPDEIAAAAIAICHSAPRDGYAAGTMLCAYKFGAGKMYLNTFRVLDNIDKHPAADQLLLNLIARAADSANDAVAPASADFDARFKELGME